MDVLDKKILSILIKDPITPFIKIAKDLGISSNTVQKRYEKMKENDIVHKESVILDLSKIGYKGKVFLFISNAKDYNSQQTVDFLKDIENLFFVVEMVGTFDILAMGAVKNVQNLKEMIRKIRSHPSVKRVETAITDDSFVTFQTQYTELIPF
jgi:DNA-binding Lrp family transcriptional regulator